MQGRHFAPRYFQRASQTAIALVLVLGTSLMHSSPALAAPPANDYFEINVDAIAAPANDANSGAGGVCTLRDAIAAANASAAAGVHADGCTVTAVGTPTTDYVINIPASYTYTLNGTELLVALTAGDNLYMVGASAASSIIQADPCNPVTLPGACTPATWRVLRHNAAAGSLLEIDSLTIRHGRCTTADPNCTTAPPEDDRGGGIQNYGSLILNDSIVTGNFAQDAGGGIMNEGPATVTITNSMINSNFSGSGGAIHNNNGGSVTLTNSQANSNTSDFRGAGIRNTGAGSTVIIQNSEVDNNTLVTTGLGGNGGGGGIANNAGTVQISNSSVSGNNSSSINPGALGGGGIYAFGGGSVTLTNTTMSGNTSGTVGGGIRVDAATTANFTNGTLSGSAAGTNGGGLASSGIITMNGTVVSGNTAAVLGGGLYFNGGSFTLTGITVNTNGAVSGGGITVDDTTPVNGSISGALIRGNTASDSGGGILMLGGTLTVTGSRIRSNTAAVEGGAYFHADGATSVTSSCIVGNSSPAVFNNTGVTQTFTGDWWGAASGPGPVGPGTGDTISALIDTLGFLTAPPAACPAPAANPAPIVLGDPVITKSGSPETAALGDAVTWTVTVTNPGPNPTDNIIFVRDGIPPQFDITGVTATPRGTVSIVGQDVRVDIGVLNPGETITIVIDTVVNSLGSQPALCNTASADLNNTFTATACLTVFPGEIPATGGKPVSRVPFMAIVLAGLGIAALIVSAGVAFKLRRA